VTEQMERPWGITRVVIERVDPSTVRIRWSIAPPTAWVTVCAGHGPEGFDRRHPAAHVQGGTGATISGLDPDTRSYFELVPEHGPAVVTAERRVPLERSVNFRDLGGYVAADGSRVKWGRVFRSDNLSRLTDRDQALLAKLDIKVVCDFRTPVEVEKGPDRLPNDSVQYVHLPVTHGEFDFTLALERLKRGDDSFLSVESMVEGYLVNLEQFADRWAAVLRRLAVSENLPLVFHCTGGKDRAGTCAALLLLALGVPEQTVIEDHQMSNECIAPMLPRVFARMESLGVEPSKVAPYFSAPRECVLALTDHVRKTYGSAENYFRTKAGVDEETLRIVKEQLLER